MQLLLRFFRNRTIGFKLLLYFFMLILLPVVTLGVIGNLIYSRSIEEQANSHTEQMLEQVSRNVEFYIHDMENIIYYLSTDSEVLQFFAAQAGKTDTERQAKVQALLGRYTKVHPEIAGILLVNAQDEYLSNEMVRIARDPLTEELWYKTAAVNQGKIHLFSKPIGRNVKAVLNYSADDVVAVAKAVVEPTTGRCLGVILIDLKLDIVKHIIETATLGKTGFLYIMDASGGIVYSPLNPVVYRVKSEWLQGGVKSVEKTIRKNAYQIMYKDSEYTNWKTVGVFSLNETLREVAYIRHYAAAIGIVTLLLATVFAFFFTASIAKPLGKLRTLMQKAEDGDLKVRFNSKYNDEIGELGHSFNRMLVKIADLIDLVYREQKRKREAELKILQAQIKPHFLYNTLDTIHWMAEERGASDIVAIVAALANLFRISLSKGQEIITVSEELEHVRSYLIIQKVRYEDKLDYEIIFAENVLKCKVLKVILQPLVENAIYHGLNARRGGGKITITVGIKADKLFFCVSDNGQGMTQEQLQAVQEIVAGQREPVSTGFGVFNVNERLRLTFGAGYGLCYYSEYGKGTIVEIWHPLRQEG